MCLAAIWWARIGNIYYGNTRDDAAAIGFDDALIYKEISSDITERRLPVVQLMHKEALQVFEEWKVSQNKMLY